jgi:Uma2 family endonuclease
VASLSRLLYNERVTALPHNLGDFNGMRMTADEFLALGETSDRYELIHGTVVMSPSALANHNRVLLEIAYQLETFAKRTGGIIVIPETDIRFSGATVYRPDIAAYRSGRLAEDVTRLDEAPDLIVEVLSGGTKMLDLITKRDDYDRFGVGEYWTVDPNTAELRCWRRQGSRLCEVPIEGDTVASTAIAGFELELAPIRKIAGV